jgi:hypothetical protein
MGQGAISSIQQLHIVLPHPCDHHLEAYLSIEQLNSWRFHSVSNPETMVSNTLEHFKEFDDPDLKCMLSDYADLLAHMNSHRQIL